MKYESLHNPKTTETLTILESTAEVFRFEFALAPRGEIAGAHVHPYQHQTLSVLSGTLHCVIAGEDVVLGPGESRVIAPGTFHHQANPTNEVVRAIEEFRPARRMHDFFRVLFALARDGHTDERGAPPLLLAAALFHEFADSIAPGSRAARLAIGVLAPFARLIGKDRLIRRYLV